MRFFEPVITSFKKRLGSFIFLLCTAILITVAAVIFKTPFYRVLPLYVSLFVMMYQSEANRFSHLIGGANSILYAIVYFSLGLYASASSSLFFSFPVSIVTFILWNRRAYKKSVVFRTMSIWVKIPVALITVGSWLMLTMVFKPSDSAFALLDNGVMVLGILVTVMSMLAYKEYTYIGVVHVSVSLMLKIQLVLTDISNLPFLIYTSYNTVCYVRMLINVRRLCREQKAANNNQR